MIDLPAFPDNGYATLADRLAAIMGTQHDVVFMQAEAVVALEAVATSLARPGLKVLNIVTSPYGRWFGAWLTRGGSAVTDVVADPGLPIRIEAIEEALKRQTFDAVALVHAESATGILNPLPRIAALVRAHGALLIVDAVASIGGHAFAVDHLGVDIAVIGPQKGLGGPSGISALSISPRAWESLNTKAGPAPSILSLADQHNWIASGRGVLTGAPSGLEFWALAEMLDRIETEGLATVIARHQAASAASRAGLTALGLRPFVDNQSDASALITTVIVPEGKSVAEVLNAAPREATLSAGIGAGAERLIRLNHTGPRAQPETVAAGLRALALALGL